MKKLHITALLAALVATPVYAVDLVSWGTSGAWTIFQDPNNGNSCLAQAQLSDGSIIRMGFQDKGKKGFLANFNPAWKEFKIDRKYPVTYMLDADTFEAEAHGKEVAGMPGAEIHFEDINLLVDLATKNTMTFMYGGAEIVKIDLKGSKDAMTQVVACQAEVG